MFTKLQNLLDATRAVDFLGPLALRLYLVPIFLMASTNKFASSGEKMFGFSVPETAMGIFPIISPNTVFWFGDAEQGLGLPFPELLAYMASYTEFIGAFLLLIGFAVRWISIPLMFTMIVAVATVHGKFGWLAIAEGSGFFATDRTMAAVDRLDRGKDILREHGNYSWLTEHGNFVVSNNGMEFAVTYFIMLLVLFFVGAGKFFSIDHWIAKIAGRV